MYNKDNKITVGYRNKKRYKAMLNNLFNDLTEQRQWTKDELYYFPRYYFILYLSRT